MFNNNLWEIKKNNSTMFHFDNKIKEKINTANLDLILKSGYNKTYTCSNWLEQFHCSFTDVQSQLKKVKSQIRNGFLVVKAQVNEYGRANYKKNISMTMLPSDIRQALSIDTSTDYDIQNAQPEVLFNICKKMKLDKKEYKYLKDYCRNRNKWIERLSKTYKTPEENKKGLFKVMVIATAFFGGSIDKFVKDKGLVCDDNNKDLVKLKKEVEKIVKRYIISNNPDIYGEIIVKNKKEFAKKMEIWTKASKIKKDLKKPYEKNPNSSISSFFLQNWERIIIETVILELTEQEKMVKNRFIYCYDGFQDDADIKCSDLQQIVKNKIGFDLTFTIKDCLEGKKIMERVNELMDEDLLGKEHPEYVLESFDIKYLESLKYDYKLQKDYWERFVCFTVKDGNYWLKNTEKLKDPETGRIRNKVENTPYKYPSLLESFGDVISIEYVVKRTKDGDVEQEKETPFIKRWRKEGMRKYFKMDFYPENKPSKEREQADIYNTFSGYPEYVYDKSKSLKANMKEKYKKIWEGILINLLGNKEAMIQFNNIISFKIKYPSRKKPFGIIIKGRQGSGKNFILSRIAKVIGEEHFLTTSNAKDVIGDYAMGLFHKLIVNLNEMDLTSTKSLTNRFKSIVSENTITFNPKHSNQFEAVNYALNIITTNEMCPIVLDVMTGERRWFIFEGNGLNTKISQEKWTKIHDITDSDDFTKFLYDYYNDMESEKYDFKDAKNKNSKSEAYNNVASLFIPYELLFLKDFFLHQTYRTFIMDEEPDTKFIEKEDPLGGTKQIEVFRQYHDYDSFYKPYQIELGDLLSEYWEWSKLNKVGSGEEKKQKSFMAKLNSFHFKNLETGNHKENRRKVLKFRPNDIMKQIIEKKAFDDDMTIWRTTDIKGKEEIKKTDQLDFLDIL